MHSLILRCPCNKPWARFYNGVLSVDSRHAGKFHTNAIAVSLLYALMQLSLDADLSQETIALPAGFKRNRITDHRTRSEVTAIALLCHERECGRPWAHVYGGRLIVDAWHNFEDHRNDIALPQLSAVVPVAAMPEFRVMKGVV